MAVGQALGCTAEVDHLPIGTIVAGLLQRTSLRMASLSSDNPLCMVWSLPAPSIESACRDCGGVVSRSRADAHRQHWCAGVQKA